MPFDNRNHEDLTPIRRALYHPGAPLAGVCASQTLRLGYAAARQRGRALKAQARIVDLERPDLHFIRPDAIVSALVGSERVVDRTSKWTAGHFTHAYVHVVFTMLQQLGRRARLVLEAGPDDLTVDATASVTLDLTSGDSRVDPGTLAPWEPRNGAFETLVALELDATTRDAVVVYSVSIAADNDNAGASIASSLAIDSVSFWLESRG